MFQHFGSLIFGRTKTTLLDGVRPDDPDQVNAVVYC